MDEGYFTVAMQNRSLIKISFGIIFVLALTLEGVSQTSTNNSKLLWEKAKEESEARLNSLLVSFQKPIGIDFSNYSYLNHPEGFQSSEGLVSRVQYLEQDGTPVFYLPSNVNAAITTGANHLQPNGSLNLNLTGRGILVGIFDQTRPKRDHVEFGTRLIQKDGSTETISEHATHVSGTIMAAGINAGAKGMAYEANGWAFNWESDISKMLANSYDPAANPGGILLSNHSYGIALGWRQNGSSWVWQGNASVDPDEDWRFGFYTSKSQAIDELVYSRPYYTVVWAAGNDRDDRGDGTREPDGPEDTIGPEGVAKNNLTIGAVSQVLNYQNANSVSVSSFSSWGPSDDGRIKPDLVGMGVNVFSTTIASGQDGYASLSGTSMASPNVTGSLLLLQQLYGQRNPDKFMWASTLKALAIQTAKEAGPAPGPDYMYGWGLLDVKTAAELILNEDGSSSIVRELILANGETYEYEFLSDGVTPIKATIAWTDPAGTPQATAVDPTGLMLVNDLDLRIFDEEGKEFFPWTLDPAQGAGARGLQNADNFRDNVEQVLISSTVPKKYRLVISHKGTLRNGVQPVSLIFTAGVQDGASETLYWIGGSTGDWFDGNNWSTIKNGPSSGKVPSSDTRVVFDGNTGDNYNVTISSAAEVFSLNSFGNQVLNLNLGQNELVVTNSLRINNQVTQVSNGTIRFESSSSNELLLEFGNTAFSEVSMSFNSGKWKVISAEMLDEVNILASSVNFDMDMLSVNSLAITDQGSLGGSVSQIVFSENFIINGGAGLKSDLQLKFSGSGLFKNDSQVAVDFLEINDGILSLASGGVSNLKIQKGTGTVNTSQISIATLELGPSAILDFAPSTKLALSENLIVSATSAEKAKLSGSGTFEFDLYKKICVQNLDVTNVNKTGQGIINLGTTAQTGTSTGWLKQNCDDVLFANFETSFNCVGAAVSFENLSEGAISSYAWNFAGLGTSNLENPTFVFSTSGEFEVELTISNSQGSTKFIRTVSIGANELAKPVIVANGNQLTSQQPGPAYQWYLNGQPIAGATARTFVADGDGIYQVALVDGACNRISDPVVISAIPESDLSKFGVFVGPIPTEDQLTVRVSNEFEGSVIFRIYDSSGREIQNRVSGKNNQEIVEVFNLPNQKGLYILKIQTNDLILHKKVIKF